MSSYTGASSGGQNTVAGNYVVPAHSSQMVTVTFPTSASITYIDVGTVGAGHIHVVDGYFNAAKNYPNSDQLDLSSWNHNFGIGSFSVNMDCGGNPTTNAPPPAMSNMVYTVKNNSTVPHTYYICDTTTGTYSSPVTLQPGQSQQISMSNVPAGDVANTFLAVENTDGTVSQDDSIVYGVTPTISGGSSGSGTETGSNSSTFSATYIAPVSGKVPVQYNPTNNDSTVSNGVTAPIIYTGTNSVTSQQEGDAAIYSAIVELAAQNHQDESAIVAAVKASTNGSGLMLTNDSPDIATNFDGQVSAGSSAAAGGSNMLASAVGGLPSGTADSQDTGAGGMGTAPSNWSVSAYGFNFDLNPFDRSWVVALAAWCRGLVKWGLLAALIIRATNKILAAVQAAGANRQATEAGAAGIFNNIPLVSSIAAGVCATLITLVSIGLVVAGVAYCSHYLGIVSTSPLTSYSGVEVAIWMVNQFLPLSVMVGCVFSELIFNASFTGVVWFTQKVTLFIVG